MLDPVKPGDPIRAEDENIIRARVKMLQSSGNPFFQTSLGVLGRVAQPQPSIYMAVVLAEPEVSAEDNDDYLTCRPIDGGAEFTLKASDHAIWGVEEPRWYKLAPALDPGDRILVAEIDSRLLALAPFETDR